MTPAAPPAAPPLADPAAAFALLRGVALYLLSVLTAMGALFAWPLASSPGTALIVALAAAAALVGGEAGAAAAATTDVQTTWRARGRVLFAIGYAAVVAIAVMIAASIPEPRVLARGAVAFAAVQPALLLIAAAMGDVRPALTNALVLVVIAALRGGAVAALTAIAAFVLTATFLLADNAVRILAAYAARRGPAMAIVLREAITLVVPVAVVLAALLWLAPPRPWVSVRWTSGPPGELPRRFYVAVFLASLLGAGAVGVAVHFLRRRRHKPPPTEDVIDAMAVDDEPLPERRDARRPTIPGRRGLVVRSYVSFLHGAARRGRPRHADATPREYEASLGQVAGLPRLTALFMDARYGPDDPSAESVAAAEASAEQALRDMAARARSRRRPGPR